MILLVHMIFGAAIGHVTYQLTGNLHLTFIAALLCHYFLDMFPHVEYLKSIEESINLLKNSGKQGAWGDVVKVFLDFILGILAIFLFSNNSPLLYVSGLMAIAPDGLTVVTKLFPNRILLWHQYFHENIIHALKHKKISNFWRVSTQVLATLISIFLFKL